MNKNERKYLYRLIKECLALNPVLTCEEEQGGIAVLATIQKCEENKDEFCRIRQQMERSIQKWKEEQEDEDEQ